ncbi:MAG: TOBE domain-containing protein, partial [Burkholderiales bacterium]
ADFLGWADGEDLLLDCEAAGAEALAKRLYARLWLVLIVVVAFITVSVGYVFSQFVESPLLEVVIRDMDGEFIGQGLFLPGEVLGNGRIRLEVGEFVPDVAPRWPAGTAVDVLLRPDDVLHDDASPMQATVLHKAFRGAEFLYTLQLPHGGQVYSLVPSHHNHAIGEKIGIRLELDHLVAYPRDPGAAQIRG